MKPTPISLLEKQIGAGKLVDSLFWIPTRIWKSEIPLEAHAVPTDIVDGCTYINAAISSTPNQISISPPLVRFSAKSLFRAKQHKNSAINNENVDVYIYGSLQDNKKLIKLRVGDKVVLKGFLRGGGFRNQIELHGAQMVSKEELAQLNVSYSARGNDAPSALQSAIFNALQLSIPDAVKQLKKMVELDYFDELMGLINLGLEINFKNPEDFFWSLHLPKSELHFSAAKQAAANLGVAEIMRRAKRASMQPENPDSIIKLDKDKSNNLVKEMRFNLTKDQAIAMRQIYHDLVSGRPMRRLLSGDVGTGKTCVFGVIAAATQLSGGSVAIYMPNGILVNQVACELKRWWPHIPVQIVTASLKPSKEDLKSNPILIGTSALLSYWPANIDRLPNLLIVDEQQKSSREQRELLIGPHTNFLEATATCLPRTMGLVEHGSLNISIVREQPVKKSISSKIISNSEEKSAVFAEIQKLIEEGKRCAIVLPEVDAKLTGNAVTDAENEKKSVVKAVGIWETTFPGKVVGLHGRMKESEKIDLLNQVKEGKFPIVLATSLIEIGVTIPNLCLVVVVSPEKYGTSSLHQIRGRLVRNGGEGKFYLSIDDGLPEKTMVRLNAVCSTLDGFDLAMSDFEARGFGDLSVESSEQSGDPVCLFKNIRILPSDIQKVVYHLKAFEGLAE